MTSRSFMDAIRSVGRKSATINEGAKDKTSDGMTKDAKRFAQDLHKVQDPGMKHLVQKDSESKDYERMFKPNIEKFPSRPADMEPTQSVDKYVEYNESVEEAKRLSKKDDQKTGDNPDNEDSTGPMTNEENKCGKDCECEDCKTVNESQADAIRRVMAKSGRNASGIPVSSTAAKPAAAAPAAAPPSQADRIKSVMAKSGRNASGIPVSSTAAKPAAAAAAPAAARPAASGLTTGAGASNVPVPKPRPAGGSLAGATPDIKVGAARTTPKANVPFNNEKPAKIDQDLTPKKAATPPGVGSAQAAKPGANRPTAPASGLTTGAGASNVPVPKPKPTAAPAAKAAAKPAAKVAAKPATAKPVTAKPSAPKPQRARLQSKTQRDDIAGPSHLRQSYDIEWNGKSYVLDESAVNALNLFIEKYGIEEGTAGEFIKKEMAHPEKLTAKGNKQKIKQSLAIYYSKKRRGENP